MAHEAARWAFEGDKGAKAAVKSGLSGDFTRNMVDHRIRELKSNAGHFLDARDHLN